MYKVVIREGRGDGCRVTIYHGFRCTLKCLSCPFPPYLKDMESPLSGMEGAIRGVMCERGGEISLAMEGGDPFIRGDLPRLLSWLGGLKLPVILKSPLQVPEDVLKGLEIEPNITLLVPLFSENPRIHDDLSNVRGSHERTLKGIETLLARGVKLRGRIPLTRRGIRNLSRTIALFNRAGVVDIEIHLPLLPSIDLQGIWNSEWVLPELPFMREAGRAIFNTLKYLERVEERGEVRVTSLGLPLCSLPHGVDYTPSIPESAGHLLLLPDGSRDFISTPPPEEPRVCKGCEMRGDCPTPPPAYLKVHGTREFKAFRPLKRVEIVRKTLRRPRSTPPPLPPVRIREIETTIESLKDHDLILWEGFHHTGKSGFLREFYHHYRRRIGRGIFYLNPDPVTSFSHTILTLSELKRRGVFSPLFVIEGFGKNCLSPSLSPTLVSDLCSSLLSLKARVVGVLHPPHMEAHSARIRGIWFGGFKTVTFRLQSCLGPEKAVDFLTRIKGFTRLEAERVSKVTTNIFVLSRFSRGIRGKRGLHTRDITRYFARRLGPYPYLGPEEFDGLLRIALEEGASTRDMP